LKRRQRGGEKQRDKAVGKSPKARWRRGGEIVNKTELGTEIDWGGFIPDGKELGMPLPNVGGSPN